MKKIIFIVLFIILITSGCRSSTSNSTTSSNKKNISDSKDLINTVDDAFWGNYNNLSWICETDKYIYVGLEGNFRIDKKTGEAENICTNPTCFHKKNCASSGDMYYIQSSGEHVFGLLRTTNNYYADTTSFVELEADGTYNDVVDKTDENNNYSVFAILDDMVYLFDNSRKVTYLKVYDVINKKEIKSVPVDFGKDNDTYSCCFIIGDDMYCKNDFNDFKKVNITTGKVTDISQNILDPQPIDNYIYFQRSNKDDEGNSLYRMDINGRNIVKISDNCLSYNIYSNTIYYVTNSYPKTLCSMEPDGKNNKELYRGSDELGSVTILPKSNLIAFTDADDDSPDRSVFYCCDFNGKNLKKISMPDEKV